MDRLLVIGQVSVSNPVRPSAVENGISGKRVRVDTSLSVPGVHPEQARPGMRSFHLSLGARPPVAIMEGQPMQMVKSGRFERDLHDSAKTVCILLLSKFGGFPVGSDEASGACRRT